MDIDSLKKECDKNTETGIGYKTFYSDSEDIAKLMAISHIKSNTVNKGIHDMQIGNITNPIAERHAEVYKYYETRKHGALYDFNVLIFADFKDLYLVSLNCP